LEPIRPSRSGEFDEPQVGICKFNTEIRARLIALRQELRTKSQSGNFSRDENLHLTPTFIERCLSEQGE
jgi:hypothetical protein